MEKLTILLLVAAVLMLTQVVIQGVGEKHENTKMNFYKARKLAGNKHSRSSDEECVGLSGYCGPWNNPPCCSWWECEVYCAVPGPSFK
uniref:Conopeptide Mi034 n=1 Tax=Conus miles TaxID=69564 RepID=A0A0E3SU34_CONMI|nr:conopeptide Mi034 [Conus miles]